MAIGSMDNPVALRARRIEAAARIYRLALPERQIAARSGDLSGRRTGNSIEYQDRKDYVPGDDVRHIDWRAYARNDRLTVKLYREEITPRVDILVDMSRSMEVTPEKRERLLELALFLHRLAASIHALVRVEALGNFPQTVPDIAQLDTIKTSPRDNPLPHLAALPGLRAGGIKIFVSDFLFPFDPAELIAMFPRADRLVFVQVVSEFEDNPSAGGEERLLDAETDQHLDVALDRTTVEGYLKRLNHLREELRSRLRVAGGVFAAVRDTDSFDDALRALLDARAIAI